MAGLKEMINKCDELQDVLFTRAFRPDGAIQRFEVSADLAELYMRSAFMGICEMLGGKVRGSGKYFSAAYSFGMAMNDIMSADCLFDLVPTDDRVAMADKKLSSGKEKLERILELREIRRGSK